MNLLIKHTERIETGREIEGTLFPNHETPNPIIQQSKLTHVGSIQHRSFVATSPTFEGASFTQNRLVESLLPSTVIACTTELHLRSSNLKQQNSKFLEKAFTSQVIWPKS
ncbi:ribosome biogenesis erb1 [Gossypium arboreum]|uniref:Ribosome biogenesis erb1 n=2 Tax=Gossypium arboreum TaxID=29729 RepID=A0A0B0MW47_GOSAR|nr:hypothetical protein PVK06_028036 [Gossypium arboreum]KHG03171.1 ribosome biogenesis erb1 [Gossypium arboreum]